MPGGNCVAKSRDVASACHSSLPRTVALSHLPGTVNPGSNRPSKKEHGHGGGQDDELVEDLDDLDGFFEPIGWVASRVVEMPTSAPRMARLPNGQLRCKRQCLNAWLESLSEAA